MSQAVAASAFLGSTVDPSICKGGEKFDARERKAPLLSCSVLLESETTQRQREDRRHWLESIEAQQGCMHVSPLQLPPVEDLVESDVVVAQQEVQVVAPANAGEGKPRHCPSGWRI